MHYLLVLSVDSVDEVLEAEPFFSCLLFFSLFAFLCFLPDFLP